LLHEKPMTRSTSSTSIRCCTTFPIRPEH
jgi:hypothetical protein